MPDTAPWSRGRNRQKFPRIEAEEAARIYERCAGLEEDVSGPLTSSRRVGFDKFISQLEERILQLAVPAGFLGRANTSPFDFRDHR